MKMSNVINFRTYSSFHIFSETIDTRPSDLVTIMIKKSVLHRYSTVPCSIHIPPNYAFGGNELDKLINQLHSSSL